MRNWVQMLRGKPQEWENQASEFPPEYVDSGPILENVKSGDEINLLEFPVPKWHELDGGRFIGTGSVVVTKDLDSDWINLGCLPHDGARREDLRLNMVAGKHGRQQLDRYFSEGKPFPRCGFHRSPSPALSFRWSGGQLRDQRVQLCRRYLGRAGTGHQG